jgi:hypothetical protein
LVIGYCIARLLIGLLTDWLLAIGDCGDHKPKGSPLFGAVLNLFSGLKRLAAERAKQNRTLQPSETTVVDLHAANREVQDAVVFHSEQGSCWRRNLESPVEAGATRPLVQFLNDLRGRNQAVVRDDAVRTVSPFANDHIVSRWNNLVCLGNELAPSP